MSDFFGRRAELIIGLNSWLYPDLEMEFEFEFDIDPDPNIGKITIYNLNAHSVNNISKGEKIIFNAGYGNDLGTIFKGIVYSIKEEKTDTEYKTEIKCINVKTDYLNTNINYTYVANSNAKHIIEDLFRYTGMFPNALELEKNIIYPRGFIAHGKVKDIISRIARECGSQLIINNTIVGIYKHRSGIATGYYLKSNTGLLEVSKIEQEENNNDEKEQAEWKIKMLLNHNISTKSLLQVKSKKFNGNCMVLRGSHKNFITEVEVVGIG